MKAEEAAKIIDSMSESLRTVPNQFQFEIHITGLNIDVKNGATGLISSPIGGGPGSTTIGTNISLNDAQVKVVQKRVTEAMKEEIQTLIDKMNELAKELRAEEPDKSKISKIYESLKDLLLVGIVPIIKDVLAAVLAAWLSSGA
jgi:uncharacterized FlaG/YvyC family protein